MDNFFSNFLKLGDYARAADFLNNLSPADILPYLSDLQDAELIAVCRNLDADILAEVLVELPSSDLQKKIIEGLRDDELDEVMEEVSPEDTAIIIKDLPTDTALKIAESDEITVLLQDHNFSTLKPILAEMNEIDVAKVIENLEPEEVPILFRLLPKDLAADTFVEMDPEQQEELISRLNNKELKDVMEELFVDDVVDIVEEMPANVVRRMLSQSDAETRAYINELLKYPKDSTGSIMTVEYVCLYPKMTVSDAFDKIYETAIDKETIYTCYVVDEGRHLIGIVTAKDLMLAKKTATIESVMETNLIYAKTLDDREDTARTLTDYGFLALPVVDEEKRLVGIVTVDDAIDVLQEENTEDIAKMAAVVPSDKPYLKTSVLSIWKNRIPWLLVLMISATFTGLILNVYEQRLSAISTVLFACVPMIMDTGGNAGSQASVTVIRALALNELTTKDVLKVLWKEVRASFLLGISLAIACFAKLMLIDNLLFGYADYTVVRALIVSMALVFTVIIAKIVGCMLPMLAKSVKLDPAVVASPFITTIVDALSLILYCGLAVSILS